MSENRLAFETSPYLLQHRDNPVHWWAWGPEALAEAKRTGKPILLSVGYAACHWCHVMAHESFEDQATADVMNAMYINIKVDREERPDIDAIYMGALHRLGEQGGWPLTMFLDSEARPFWGGTYFPKDARYGRPAFVTVLLRIAEAFQNQKDNVASNAAALMAALADDGDDRGDGANRHVILDQAEIKDLVSRITRAVDPVHGGLSGAPKFPQWNVFWLLWRSAIRFNDGAAKAAVVTTLTNICQGGIYDHLGGGFARYSVDERWLVPHFEKMLYDNALLIDLLTEVWRETQDPLYAQRIDETIAWVAREMIADGGGFAASLDADSEGEEGKFYVWSLTEIIDVLGETDGAAFEAAYDVTAAGNFEGHTILNRLGATSPLNEAQMAPLRQRLFERRARRVRPGWDDKVLADWNGLMIAALARASTCFAKPAWLAMAVNAFDAIVKQQSQAGDRLWHSYRAGQAKAPATASDYANMTWAAIRLFEATNDARYLGHAQRWTEILRAHYWEGATGSTAASGETTGGYFTAADDTLDVIVRLKSASDDAVPSANAIQLWNLIALAALTGDTTYDDDARQVVAAFGPAAASRPMGHCGLLAASLDLDDLIQVVITGLRSHDLANVVAVVSVPGAIELCSGASASGWAHVGGLAGKIDADGPAAGFVCRGPVCGAPIMEPEPLKLRLKQVRRWSDNLT